MKLLQELLEQEQPGKVRFTKYHDWMLAAYNRGYKVISVDDKFVDEAVDAIAVEDKTDQVTGEFSFNTSSGWLR